MAQNRRQSAELATARGKSAKGQRRLEVYRLDVGLGSFSIIIILCGHHFSEQ